MKHDLPDRIIAQPELLRLVPYSEVHLRRLEQDNRFPRRLHLGPRRVGWRLSEVMAWIEARSAERHSMEAA